MMVGGSKEYKKIHHEMGKKYGTPAYCLRCMSYDTERKYQWAHKHNSPWNLEPQHWIRLCVKCHDTYDGHPSPGFRGKSHDEQSKLKTSAAVVSHLSTLTPVDRKKYGSLTWLGREHSPETKAKISAARQGMPAPNKGIPHTEATKAKLRGPKKRVTCTSCGASIVLVARHNKAYHAAD